MLKFLSFLSFVFLFNSFAYSDSNQAVASKMIHEDIKKTMGLVPGFMRDLPDGALEGVWQDMKGIELNASSAIPGKYKELIALAVSAQIPSKNCVYFHTKAASLYGVTDREINEALAYSGHVRRWSSFLHGTQSSMSDFKSEVNKMIQMANKNKARQAMEESKAPMIINTPEDAYKDIEANLGLVPSFLKNYPANGIVGVWKEMKGLEMNPKTDIPAKYRELLSLAVASQVPCQYCVYYHTQFAMFHGASTEEIREAVAMAGIEWKLSTIINGKLRNEKNFQTEIDKMINFMSAQSKKTSSI